MLVVRLICVLILMVGYRNGRLWPFAAGADSIRVLGRSELRAGRKFLVKVVTNLGFRRSVDFLERRSMPHPRAIASSRLA